MQYLVIVVNEERRHEAAGGQPLARGHEHRVGVVAPPEQRSPAAAPGPRPVPGRRPARTGGRVGGVDRGREVLVSLDREPLSGLAQALPPGPHRLCPKGEGQANIVEALNCFPRQRGGGLVRKSCAFSKSLSMYTARINICIDQHNQCTIPIQATADFIWFLSTKMPTGSFVLNYKIRERPD